MWKPPAPQPSPGKGTTATGPDFAPPLAGGPAGLGSGGQQTVPGPQGIPVAPHTPLQPYYDYFPQGRGFQPAAAPEPAGYEYASSDHLYTSQQQPQVYGAPLPPYGRAAAGPARAPSGSTAASSSHLINGYWMPQQGTWPAPSAVDVEYGGLGAPLLGPSYLDDSSHLQALAAASRQLRHDFIRKVFGLVLASLAVTAGAAAAVHAWPAANAFVARQPWLLLLSFVVSIGTLLALALSEDLRRRHPQNLWAYGAFTCAQALLVAVATASLSTWVLVIGFGITAAACAALALAALQTRRDFTAAGGVLMAGVTVLLCWSVLSLALPPSAGAQVAFASLGALLFSFYLVWDVQLLLGGRHAYSVEPDEYVFAALSIYVDVINLLLYVLQLTQRFSGDQ